MRIVPEDAAEHEQPAMVSIAVVNIDVGSTNMRRQEGSCEGEWGWGGEAARVGVGGVEAG